MTATPPKPAQFTPEAAPVGVEVNYASYWRDRAFIKPRIQLCHTNAATNEGSIEASRRWIESAPGVHTFPHYQVDRSGRACKFLPTNRKGIANQTVASARGTHGTVQDWSLAYETADTGTLADPTISAYTDPQAETLAQILAYESIVHGIPLEIPTEWYGSGTASHTDPFGYPYWTNAVGKTCPGGKKKAQLRATILPRARAIRAVWLDVPPPPVPVPDPSQEDDDDMAFPPILVRTDDGQMYATDERFTFAYPVDEETGGQLRDWRRYGVAPDSGPHPLGDLDSRAVRAAAKR